MSKETSPTQQPSYYPYSSTYQPRSSQVQRSRSPSIVQPQSTRQVQQRIKKDLIKGDSRIEYVPVEKKVVDYVDERKYSIVPKTRKIVQYKDFVRVDFVPREVISTDYYAVEHIRSYIPQVIPEKYTDYVPVERKNISYEYIPVQRQLVHCPETVHEQEQSQYLGVKQYQGPKRYENLRESDIHIWERDYGYVRGQPIEVLNQKIQAKIQRDKELYFKQFETDTTSTMYGSMNSNR